MISQPALSTARESLARLNARIEGLENPRHRKWLSTHRDHWWNEVVNDVDRVMATMSRGPIRYTFDGHPFMNDGGTMANVRSWADTKAMYDNVVALGVRMAGPTDNERILFDNDGLSVQCILTTVYPGVFLTSYDATLDPNGYYLLRWPNITSLYFDDSDLLMGEDILNGAPILIRQVDRSAIDAIVDGPLPDLD